MKPQCNRVPSLKLTACPWKLVVGRLLSFWEGPFSGAMLVLGRVIYFYTLQGTNIPPLKIKNRMQNCLLRGYVSSQDSTVKWILPRNPCETGWGIVFLIHFTNRYFSHGSRKNHSSTWKILWRLGIPYNFDLPLAGVIILPTQTMHYSKGNPWKVPYICSVSSPQMGSIMTPVWGSITDHVDHADSKPNITGFNRTMACSKSWSAKLGSGRRVFALSWFFVGTKKAMKWLEIFAEYTLHRKPTNELMI